MAQLPITARVAGIPVFYLEPSAAVAGGGRRLAIWLPGFSGTKESQLPQLQDLAADGFVAMSFDMAQHGERLVDADAEALVTRVRSNLRTYFWEILDQSAREFTTLIDWAVAELGVEPVVAVGGNSAGGDTALAAAGLDPRIAAVATCVATPDWKRPGSWEPPGAPDAHSQMCYDRACPIVNIEPFLTRKPAVSFHCGADDDQVPSEAAVRFREALLPAYIASGARNRVQVQLHDGLGHGGEVLAAAWPAVRRFLSLFTAAAATSAAKYSSRL